MKEIIRHPKKGSPLKNAEWVTCKCGKRFLRRARKSGHRNPVGIRPMTAKTCSRKCSRSKQ